MPQERGDAEDSDAPKGREHIDENAHTPGFAFIYDVASDLVSDRLSVKGADDSARVSPTV